jgi:Tol biopolymer transport system component
VPESALVEWSPDGRKLGVTLVAHDEEHASVAVADLASKTIKRLTAPSNRDIFAGLSSNGAFAAFFRLGPTERAPVQLWSVRTSGRKSHRVLTLASGELGPCPLVAWSPTAPVLAIVNTKCEPS